MLRCLSLLLLYSDGHWWFSRRLVMVDLVMNFFFGKISLVGYVLENLKGCTPNFAQLKGFFKRTSWRLNVYYESKSATVNPCPFVTHLGMNMLLTDVIPFRCSIAVPSVSFYPMSMHVRTTPIPMRRACVRTRGAGNRRACVRAWWLVSSEDSEYGP